MLLAKQKEILQTAVVMFQALFLIFLFGNVSKGLKGPTFVAALGLMHWFTEW